VYKLTPLSSLGLTLAGLHDNALCKMTGQSSSKSLCNTPRVRLRRIRCPGRRVGGVGHGEGGKLKGLRAFTPESQWVYEGRCTDVGPRYGFARTEGRM